MSENPANDSKPQGGDVKESTPINLKVMGSDNTEVHFKIKETTQIKKLFQAYCDRQGVSLSTYRFLFDGEKLNPEKTPNYYQMEDDDVIEVYQEQKGGLGV